MNWINFVGLMWMIFGRTSKPDLKKIEKMGLLAVKIGQMYALRIDFLDEAKCQHLSKLYRATTPMEGNGFKERFGQVANEKLREEIEWIDKDPLASASVGQVHKARLKNGEEVVIKVLKADFKERFLADVRSLRRFVKFVLFFYPKLKKVADPLGVLHQIEKDTVGELDLENEVAGLRFFEKVKRERGESFDLGSLAVPKIYEDLSNKQVLVTEFVDGITFDEALSDGDLDYSELLKLFKIHGFFMFIVGKFHGDIHPGNIILKDGRLYFVDCSSISEVHGDFGVQLLEFFKFLGRYDYDRCAEILNRMSEVQLEGKKFKKFKEKFLDVYSDFKGKAVSEISLTTKMMQTVKTAVRAGMDFEKGMFSVIKSLMYLDGMVIKCKPSAVLLEDMQEYVDEFEGAWGRLGE